jgi:thiol-disulfide isomerase/thioredoxin
MAPLPPGSTAPQVPGVDLGLGKRAVVFYKVTCPTCRMAAPAIERLHAAAPDRFVAVGQDPPDRLEEFAAELGATFHAVPDTTPYPVSEAYAVQTVPTLFALEDGRVAEVVESWDREAWNRAAIRLTGSSVSEVGDGLPPFKPG